MKLEEQYIIEPNFNFHVGAIDVRVGQTVAVIVTGVALTVFLVFYCGGVFNHGVIFHNLPGVSSASSSDTYFSSYELSFDI